MSKAICLGGAFSKNNCFKEQRWKDINEWMNDKNKDWGMFLFNNDFFYDGMGQL